MSPKLPGTRCSRSSNSDNNTTIENPSSLHHPHPSTLTPPHFSSDPQVDHDQRRGSIPNISHSLSNVQSRSISSQRGGGPLTITENDGSRSGSSVMSSLAIPRIPSIPNFGTDVWSPSPTVSSFLKSGSTGWSSDSSNSTSPSDGSEGEQEIGFTEKEDERKTTTVDAKKKKRTRVVPTHYQTSVLNAILSETRFPSTEDREKIAKHLGMSPRRVQVWFQNRRQEEKKMNRERSETVTPHSSSSSTYSLSSTTTVTTSNQFVPSNLSPIPPSYPNVQPPTSYSPQHQMFPGSQHVRSPSWDALPPQPQHWDDLQRERTPVLPPNPIPQHQLGHHAGHDSFVSIPQHHHQHHDQQHSVVHSVVQPPIIQSSHPISSIIPTPHHCSIPMRGCLGIDMYEEARGDVISSTPTSTGTPYFSPSLVHLHHQSRPLPLPLPPIPITSVDHRRHSENDDNINDMVSGFSGVDSQSQSRRYVDQRFDRPHQCPPYWDPNNQ